MGKHGPCHHCGVTNTPLWRNGPPEKPVLCNACGSRWRTKGTLTNYTPLHSRLDNVDQVPCKIPKVKFVSPRTECLNQHKRKWYNDAEEETENSLSNQNSQGIMDEDTSNRSSSGSAISYSEGCMQFMGNDANEVMGSTQSNVWDMLVPSRKRSCINRPKQSSVEKLTKDLYSILREQQSKNSQTSSGEDLLFESGSPLDSIEIGHGGVLIKHLNSVSPDELEEISLSTDNSKVITNNNMHMASILPLNIKPQIADMLSMDPNSKVILHWPEESVKSDTPPYEKFFVLRSRKSPLASLDLKDIINFEEFGKHLTWQEKQELMKYLPIVDTSQVPESLESMFKAPQFEETLLVFQRLLHDGMFDLSFGEINPEECRMLKKLVLYNLTKSEWVGYYRLLKDQKYKEKTGEERVKVEPDMVCHFSEYNKELCVDDPDDNLSEARCTIETHQRLLSHEAREKKLGSSRSLQSFKRKNLVVQGGLQCNFKSLFAAPDTISDLLLSSQCDDDGSDQDLLVDVPSYASFPQAELLDCDILKQKTRQRSENQISDFDLSLITNRHK